ncbi:MAG: transcriptional regulator [Halieaceae bacterium]|jgi:hypothetical protein|nr:transcriptional regulator [Halieaceae bacterium]
MDLKEFIESCGRDEAKLVAEKAGTIWQYVYQCAEGYRRPSVELAQKLVDASDGRLDLLAILTAEKRDTAKGGSADSVEAAA